MTGINIFILIVAIIGWATAIVITRQCYGWRKRYEVFKTSHYTELEMKDAKLAELENELKTHKDIGHVIKIEKVMLEPKEFECKFLMHERFINDKELCKKLIVSEAARYLAEEFKKDPYLYTVLTERSCSVLHIDTNEQKDFVKIKFRMLPYAEPASFNDIFKEED